MQQKSRITIVTLVVAMMLLLAFTLTVQASPGARVPPNAQPVGPAPIAVAGEAQLIHASAEEQAVEYTLWTREAMQAAVPLELPASAEAPLPRVTADMVEVEVVAAFDAVSPGMSNPQAVEAARLAYAEDWAMLEAQAEEMVLDALNGGMADSVLGPTGTSAVYTRYEMNRFTQFHTGFPFKTIGRLFYQNQSNAGYSCTASVVSGKNIIATAAHCLYDTNANKWFKNWSFVPAYRNGSAPFGTFPFQTCAVLNAWINLPSYTVSGGARYDVGLCKMKNNSAGQGLSATVGNLGQRYPGYPEHIHDIGYPSKYRNGTTVANAGKYTWACVAETRLYTTDTLAWGCDLASGMSGAPVIHRFAPFVVSGWVESIHSGGFSSPNDAHGPRLKSTNIGTLCTLLGGC